MKTLTLKGHSFLVDDEDCARVAAQGWCVNREGRAVVNDGSGVAMARFIMRPSKAETVMYRDGDLSNNQKTNLNVIDRHTAYQLIGGIGGRKGTTGGFFANRELAIIAGRKGGLISRRSRVKKETHNATASA